MNSFTVLLLCIQACLVQNVLGQCFGALNPAAITPTALGATAPFGYRGTAGELAYPAATWAGGYPAGLAPYGGAGEGNVEVAGELPVAGTTGVVGQVPIMGAVNFVGAIPAIGTVSITGNCACGAGVSYLY